MCKTRDICGIFLAIFTILLIMFGCFCCNYFCIFYWYYETRETHQALYGIPLQGIGCFYFLTFNYLCLMSFISHWRAAWADPGVVPSFKEAPGGLDPSRVKYCRKCDMNWKPERAHHCSECGKCIFKMDHHCPWVNNCVGVKNLKHFLLFILYTGLSAAYLCCMMILSFYHLMTSKSKTHQQKEGYVIAFILCVVAFIEGILFAFFCFELIQEQFESIFDNQTYVDDMKETFGRPISVIDSLYMTMGEDWNWWLIPTSPVVGQNYFEKLYTLKQLKKMKGEAPDDDDFDPDKKQIADESRKANVEKNFTLAFTGLAMLGWFLYGRYQAQQWIAV